MYRCTIIGLTDDARTPVLAQTEVRELIGSNNVFSGGKRHHELVASLLPEDAVWIDITVPLSHVFKQYAEHDEIVIFASGDPLFYGFAATVQRECPDCEMIVIPSFNSLQMLAHKLCLPYAEMRCVSLTGRPWDAFDEALIRGERMIGILTDRNKTPQLICQRMLDYGYDNYRIYVGEHLGNNELERVREYEEGMEFAMPNCMIALQTEQRPRRFGLPEAEFSLLNGRTKMITKMPIRLATLAALELGRRCVMWDVGFCTGSISIEARLQFPHLSITAFECREEGRELMSQNSRRFGVPGINAIIADFMECDLTSLNRPDAVFIGGHGGRLGEMVTRIHSVLADGGCIVFNSVSEASREQFVAAADKEGMTCTNCGTIVIDNNNPITILRAE
ncbi:MAG: precorrin-6y C5,15-methyltransferase (decarboxylating) subunit CbiE [Bacteroidaceae bacterium]|nr:precorrin-6y C5,15-methyltransferase (decarboxylating) subunit CbiE [Bacteroidaceae bacterium]